MNAQLPMTLPTQLASLEPRQLRLAGVGVVGLLLTALVMYLVLPQWRAYQVTAQSLNLLRQGGDAGDSLDAQLAALRTEVSGLEHTLHGDASNLPAKQMEGFVIGRLQTISWRNDVILVSVQPREGAPLNQFRELVFDVELRSSYFNFYDWLQDIGEELGFVVIKQFEMSESNRSNPAEDLPLKVKLTMAAYRNEDV
jgi:hypothetical protein